MDGGPVSNQRVNVSEYLRPRGGTKTNSPHSHSSTGAFGLRPFPAAGMAECSTCSDTRPASRQEPVQISAQAAAQNARLPSLDAAGVSGDVRGDILDASQKSSEPSQRCAS